MLSNKIDRLQNLVLVENGSILLNFRTDVRVLGEDDLMHETFCQGEAFDVFHIGHVDKLTLAVVDNIVIAYNWEVLELFGNMMLRICISISDKTETNADKAFCDEVHLGYFFFFVVDYLILRSSLESSWHKSKCNIVQKSCLLHRVDTKELLKVLENIRKQVNGHYLILDLSWKCLKILVISVDAGESIVRPIVVEVGLDLPGQVAC